MRGVNSAYGQMEKLARWRKDSGSRLEPVEGLALPSWVEVPVSPLRDNGIRPRHRPCRVKAASAKGDRDVDILMHRISRPILAQSRHGKVGIEFQCRSPVNVTARPWQDQSLRPSPSGCSARRRPPWFKRNRSSVHPAEMGAKVGHRSGHRKLDDPAGCRASAGMVTVSKALSGHHGRAVSIGEHGQENSVVARPFSLEWMSSTGECLKPSNWQVVYLSEAFGSTTKVTER